MLLGEQDEEEMQLLTERMKALLGPFVLRRLKSEVASQLAAKDQRVELVDMTSAQAGMYGDAVLLLRREASAAGLQAGWLSVPFLILLSMRTIARGGRHMRIRLLINASRFDSSNLL